MTEKKQSRLLAFLVLAALAGGLWFTGGADSGGPEGVGAAGLQPGAPGPANGSASTGGGETELEGVREAVPETVATESGATTVIWPLELELTLVESGVFGDAKGLDPIGSGADAGLRGSILDPQGKGLAATLTFVAGPNEGRVLRCDSNGQHGASNLYPGYSIVRIDTPIGRRAEREVLLASYKTQILTVGFGSPSTVYGKVVDRAGEGLPGATVTLDGSRTETDELGEFMFVDVASGNALALVEKPGYALYRETVPVPRGGVVQKDRMTFRLDPGADLEVTVAQAVGADGPSTLFLFPSGQQRINTVRGQRTFPWHLVSPVEIHPGGTVLIEGLPETRVSLRLYHPGAVAKPASQSKKVVAGRPNQMLLELEPAPQITGVVKENGKPVRDAVVLLEAADRSAATLEELDGRPLPSTMVMPHLPIAQQTVRTDSRGRFLLTSYPGIDRFYLRASSRDGGAIATRVVEAGAKSLELDLQPVSKANGGVRVELASRFQGLPVEVRVNGEPREPFVLAPGEELYVGELETGTWRFDASWHGARLVRSQTLKLDPDSEVVLPLPKAAIEGQSEEERRRAGRL